MSKPRRRTRWRRASFSSDGTGPYTYALTAGTLPQGLSLSGSTISGTPQFQTIKTFTITSTDSLGNTGWQTYDLSIELGGGNAPLMLAAPMLLVGDTLKYTFSHDGQGRMTAKGAQAYVYDALNRMTQVTSKESYLYDGHGRRVQVTKTSDGKLNYPIYSLDGKLLLEDNRQTLKRTEYIYAGGRLVAKRIQPITSAGANNGAATTTTIHTDFLGSPVAETNASGTVTRVERYTPYGEPADMALDVGPGFTGHATDVLTGLTYMQQRYYDAEIGRFISPDPVGPEEDFIQHFNRYNYALNNPVRYTDPDGEEPTHRNGPAQLKSGTTAPFNTQRAAGIAAVKAIHSMAIKTNKEIGGYLFKAKDGTYGIGKPVGGAAAKVEVSQSKIPVNAQVAGDYHHHGDYSKAVYDSKGNWTGETVRTTASQDVFKANNFSTLGDDSDLQIGRNAAKVVPEYKQYLGTPIGYIKEHDPAAGTIKIVDKIKPE